MTSPAAWIERDGRARESGDAVEAADLRGEGAVHRSQTTTVDPDDGGVTPPGCLPLRSAVEGRCPELRAYRRLEPGRHEPPSEWGA